jgi:outer membrane protein OmpA-like peptidoglycan-associated protein
MYSLSRRSSGLGVLILVGMVFLSGCATRRFVRNEVAALEPRITEVSNANRENAERIDAVDQRAGQGITAAATADQKAVAAQTAANTADQKAVAAQTAANNANQAVQQTNTRIAAIDARIGALDTYTAGTAESVTFTLGSSTLSEEARATLDSVASGLSGQQSGYLVEIQGFTDSTGSENTNVALSQRRAENVLRYLVGKGVPLHRISIIGLGEANPAADNTTRDGRAQNRRVEIRVLRSGATRATN